MRPEDAYAELLLRAREQSLLGSCAAALEWDEETFMPPGGVEGRSHQMALLAGLVHERSIEPRVGELLAIVEGSSLVGDAGGDVAVNVRELRHDYDRELLLPRSFVEEHARTTAVAQQQWAAARAAADFAVFRPWLERLVALARDEAGHLGWRAEPYDALLDDYEPGATAAELARLYAELYPELVALLDAIAGAPVKPDPTLLERELPIERQRAFALAVAAAIGFDFERGRLDESVHPFCIGLGPGDCRITTRFEPRDLGRGLFAVLHEVGHGLYEQGLHRAHWGTPIGEQASIGIDESQSRLWENAVGRSRAFWEHFFPRAVDHFRPSFDAVSLDAFHLAVNAVAPSAVRARADEVTYNLHVLVRFELERALLSGDLRAADVPGAWREAYARHLGVAPKGDREGCLQDGHWAEGLFGYFPSYTLGDVAAAQLFAKARADLPGLDDRMARGDFAPLVAWLRAHVHRAGRRYGSARLVEIVTGAPPGARALVERLREKYGALYRF